MAGEERSRDVNKMYCDIAGYLQERLPVETPMEWHHRAVVKTFMMAEYSCMVAYIVSVLVRACGVSTRFCAGGDG